MAWVERYTHKDGKHSWRVGWRTPEGRSRSKAFRLRRDADDFVRRLEGDKARGDYQDPALGRITLAEYFETFMEHSRHLKPSTRSYYRYLFNRYIRPELGGHPLATITRTVVATLLARIEAGPSSVRSVHRLLRRVLSAAVEDGRIARNPAARLKLPAETVREPRFLSPEEIRRLADEVPPRYRALIYLLAYGGLRIGEAAALRVGDVDFLRGRVTVARNSVEVEGRLVEGTPKGGAIRTVRIPRTVVEELSLHLERAGGSARDQDARLFTSKSGRPLRQSRFRTKVFTPAVKRAGLGPLRVHDLRHTAVALAIAAGYHPKAVQELAGHASITMTLDRYGHLFDTLQDAGVERLDEMARAQR